MYAFLLGNHPELSLAELGVFFGNTVSLNPVNNIAFTPSELPGQFLNADDFLKVLGGTIAILKIVDERVSHDNLISVIANQIEDTVQKNGVTGKFPFGVDVYPESANNTPLIKYMTIGVKKALAKNKVKSEFWNNNFRNVNRVFALKNHLINKGYWIGVLKRSEKEFMITQLVAVQDVEQYAQRDYGKAARDAQSGMLPPKVAQIMLNLGIYNRAYGVNFDASRRARVTIVDPFCGSGTVLMESMLRGFSVMGMDVTEKAVEQAQANISWLREKRPEVQSVGSYIGLKSATELKRKDIELTSPDMGGLAIVTEPYLGPPMREEPTDRTLEYVMQELSDLYIGFFKNMASWLPAETPVVCIFPCWRRTTGGITKLSSRIVEKIMTFGYSMPAYTPLHTNSLLYGRPYSIVGREILRLVKK